VCKALDSHLKKLRQGGCEGAWKREGDAAMVAVEGQ
jgi:hypothetical protein